MASFLKLIVSFPNVKFNQIRRVAGVTSQFKYVVNPTPDESPVVRVLDVWNRCALLLARKKCFLINCHEGSDRRIESNCGRKQIEHVLITHPTWDNISGIKGTIEMLNTVRLNKEIHGLSRLDPKVVEVLRIDQTKFGRKSSQQVFSVTNVPLTSNATGLQNQLRYCTSYIVEDSKRMPHILLQKLIQEKLRPEDLVGMETDGSVRLQNGDTIPFHRIGNPRSQVDFLVIDCPDETFLPSLMSSARLQEKKHVEVVVHVTPREIYTSKPYQQFINRYYRARHIFLHDNNKVTDNYYMPVQHYKQQAEMHLVNAKNFKFPTLLHRRKTFLPSNTALAEIGLEYNYMEKRFTYVENPFKDVIVDASEMDIMKKCKYEVDNYHEFLRNLPPRQVAKKYPEVVFLGTGSSRPCPYRGRSSILIHLSPDSVIMLDCGDGTLNQLYAYYGRDTLSVLKKLKWIFLSHSHSDHHLGLMALLKERQLALKNSQADAEDYRLPVISGYWFPRRYRASAWTNFCNSIYDARFFPAEKNFVDDSIRSCLYDTTGLEKITPVPVPHSYESHGIVLEHKSGWKLVYSGDTIFHHGDLIEHGKDCDLLIHEATYLAGHEDHANIKFHCTTSQALEVAKRMNAKFTILTHFSTRMIYEEALSATDESFGLAFDGMKVTLDPSDLKGIALCKEVLKKMNQICSGVAD